MRKIVHPYVLEILKEMYPERFKAYPKKHPRLTNPLEALSLDEVHMFEGYSEVKPSDPDLSTRIGSLELAIPLIPSPMDSVCGEKMAKVAHELGTFGPIFRHPEANIQLEWLESTLNHKACLVDKPISLHFNESLGKARQILKKHKFSTIPILTKNKILKGVLFTGDVAFKTMEKEGNLNDPVKKWMVSLKNLKTVGPDTEFKTIKKKLLDEPHCSVLPVVDSRNKFYGIYFMKDFLLAKPSNFNGKPLVGMAINDSPEDLERVRIGLELGVGAIIIDSSHGNCKSVIEQTRRVAALKKEMAIEFALIPGNIANIDGYYRLAMAGADAVKCFIGSGSICTTTQGTGIGVPSFTNLDQLVYLREKMILDNLPAPHLIADGNVGKTGNIVVALTLGAHVCMSGELFASALESLGTDGGKSIKRINGKLYVPYRGMAALEALEDSTRYGEGKTAAEGISGIVPYRGPLKKWFSEVLELIKGGISHTGSGDLKELREFGKFPLAFNVFSDFGQNQINTRILQEER